eukprot:Sspe_Gene.85237::Locus_56025_Transcript_1_1_Confidence_1.000_Length_1485::g.85237::m.85237
MLLLFSFIMVLCVFVLLPCTPPQTANHSPTQRSSPGCSSICTWDAVPWHNPSLATPHQTQVRVTPEVSDAPFFGQLPILIVYRPSGHCQRVPFVQMYVHMTNGPRDSVAR